MKSSVLDLVLTPLWLLDKPKLSAISLTTSGKNPIYILNYFTGIWNSHTFKFHRTINVAKTVMKEKSFVYSKTDEIIHLSKDGKLEDVSCWIIDWHLLWFFVVTSHDFILVIPRDVPLENVYFFTCHAHNTSLIDMCPLICGVMKSKLHLRRIPFFPCILLKSLYSSMLLDLDSGGMLSIWGEYRCHKEPKPAFLLDRVDGHIMLEVPSKMTIPFPFY